MIFLTLKEKTIAPAGRPKKGPDTGQPVRKRRDPALIRGVLLGLLVVPLLVFPPLNDAYDLPKAAFLWLAFASLAALWVVDCIAAHRIRLPERRLLLPVGAFALILILSTLNSINPALSVLGGVKRHEGLLVYLGYLLTAILSIAYLRPRDWRPIALTLATVVAISSIYGIFQRFGYDFFAFNTPYDPARVFAATGNPVFFGSLLALAIPVLIALIHSAQKAADRWFLATTAGLALPALLFTYSRGAWIGAALGLIAAVIFGGKSLLRYKPPVALIAAIFAAVMLLYLVAVPPDVRTSTSITGRAAATVALGEGSAATRLELWRAASRSIADRPLLGYGLETFRDIIPGYRSLKLVKSESGVIHDRPHNELLYLAVSGGIAGMAAYLWLLFALIVGSIRGALALRPQREASLSLALIAGCLGYLSASFFSFSMVAVTPIFWILAGLAMALIRKEGLQTVRLPKFPQVARYALYGLLSMGILAVLLVSARLLAADAAYNQSRNLASARNFSAAYSQAQEAVRLNPYRNHYRLQAGGVCMNLFVLTNRREWAECAVESLVEGAKRDPRDTEIWANLGIIYMNARRPGWEDKAVGAFRKLASLDPNSSLAHQRLGAIFLERGEQAASERELRRALRISATPLTYTLLGRLHAQQNRPEEAKRMYEQALKINPQFRDARLELEKLMP